MGVIIRSRQPCDYCGSSDALTQYDNGSYCFSCHRSDKNSLPGDYDVELRTPHNLHVFPEDFTNELPDKVKAWLYVHHFSPNDIIWHDIGWSDCYQRMILHQHRQWWEGRSFNKDSKVKYLSASKKHPWTYLHHYQTGIVIVEDIISAMRISKYSNVIALRGTSLNEEHRRIVVANATNFKIWLDSDKAGTDAARKMRKHLELFGDVQVISSEKDPKCYSNGEILKIIEETNHENRAKVL